MPAAWQAATARGTPARHGSLMPTNAIRVSPSKGRPPPPPQSGSTAEGGRSTYATHRVRSDARANSSMSWDSAARAPGVSGRRAPAGRSSYSHAASTTSDAPFQYTRAGADPLNRTATPIVLVALLKGCMRSSGARARASANEGSPGSRQANARSACSVGEPASSSCPEGVAATAPVVLRNTACCSSARTPLGTSSAAAGRSGGDSPPATHARTTAMRLVVRVPVLSVQMAVAPPIVSHADRWRTKALSAIMRFIE